MKSFGDVRKEAMSLLWRGRWIFRGMLVFVITIGLAIGWSFFWNLVTRQFGVQTWSDYNAACLLNMASGIDYAAPTREVSVQMTAASCLQTFFEHLWSGISAFAFAVVALKAVRGQAKGWFPESLAGFRQPFGMAWLSFRVFVQIVFWSLFFLIPGIVAFYRYSMTWFLKVDNPEWSAGKCIAESCRLMNGRKWRLCALDCSYWLSILILTVLCAVGLLLLDDASAEGRTLLQVCARGFVWGLPTMLFSAFVGLYIYFGRAIFYREIRHE